MASKRKEIISQIGTYTSATLLTQFISLIAAILTRRFLGPLQTGIWALLQVILTYSGHASLGTTDAIAREIPFYKGRGNNQKAESIKNTVCFFSIASALVVAFFLLIYAFIQKHALSKEMLFGLALTAALVVLQRINNLFIGLLRAYKQFKLASWQMIFSAVVNAILVAAFSYRYEIYGFIWAMLLSFVFNIGYILYFYDFQFEWRFDFSELKALIGYGFPLMMINLMQTFFVSIDKIMIAKMLGLGPLGLYSIAVLAYQYFSTFSTSVSTVLTPHFHERFGERENKEDIKMYMLEWVFVVCYVVPVLIGMVWFIAPPMVLLILPEFEGGIPSVKCLILSAYFLSAAQPFTQFIYTLKKHNVLFPLFIATSLLAIVLNYFAIAGGFGITGVSLATTAVIFIKFTATYFSAYFFSGMNKECVYAYVLILLKFLFMISAFMLLEWATSQWLHFSDMGMAFVQYFLLTVIYLPFLLRIYKKFKIGALLKPSSEVT